MPAPVTVATALAGTRTGRRILIGVLVALGVLVGFAVTPLVAIPFAIAGAGASAAVAGPTGSGPTVEGEWGYPLAGDYTKGRGFGWGPVVGCAYCPSDHSGYDMSQGCGSTIYAAGPGRVITAGRFLDYGNAVIIDHGNDLLTLYGHLLDHSIQVTVGDTVTAGTPLGGEGNTGRSFGCHLHFEIRDSGTRIDPQPFMAARGLPLI